MSVAIKVENLSKAYQLGQIGTSTISRDLERWFVTRVMGREDPFLKIGETNDRTTKSESGVVWSLRDINLEIEQGDAVGIIGRNGAGKSTLLKILSRVTAPTTGSVKIKGRVASLLEVGTGFHQELTGRENIYLNGSILGMRKREIDRKLDEIVDFSGVERYIDTPVKRYSSGMSVRLAFAVAAHLDSEILVVDEVLAVGDAEFQRKCLGKMGDVSGKEGRTILFVSHSMASVSELCGSCLLLDKGVIVKRGRVHDTVTYYLNQNSQLYQADAGEIRFLGIATTPIIRTEDSVSIRISLESKRSLKAVTFDVAIYNENNSIVVHSMSAHQKEEINIQTGKQDFNYECIGPNLAPGHYSVEIYINDRSTNKNMLWVKPIPAFVVQSRRDSGVRLKSPIAPRFTISDCADRTTPPKSEALSVSSNGRAQRSENQ